MMSGKMIAAMSAAILLASTALASAESAKRQNGEQQRYYNMAPDPTPDSDPTPYFPFPVTGQSAA
jgi:ABC-type oligopeptide transport system substrate-binding subunit